MTQSNNSPLNFILNEMVAVHNAGLFYAAIMISLTLPDICSKLTFEPSEEGYWKGTEKRYKAWCNEYLSQRIPTLTEHDLWALRGGVLHQGQTFGHPKSRFERVVFILPDRGGNQFVIGESRLDDSQVKPVSAISTSTFCQAFVDAVQEFIVKTQDNEIVQNNVGGLVRLRPDGYERHISGLAVIA